MEEKERYELEYDDYDFFVFDNESHEHYFMNEHFIDFLNQQDKRIKELVLLLIVNIKMQADSIKSFEKLKQENKRLKQSQKRLAMSELGKLKKSILGINKTEIKVLENGYSTLYCDRPEVITIIENQIKKLRGESDAC